jgi:ribosomal protein L11 methylase PrmA
MQNTAFDLGSFRDPSGHVFERAGEIYRTVERQGLADFKRFFDEGVLGRFVEKRKLVGTEVVAAEEQARIHPGSPMLLKHERIPFISYPYEWSFSLLKAAALHHLDLQVDALRQGYTLSDASAYNIQFIGTDPIFIDALSFRAYRENEIWSGYRQFCEQFLNPLLLRALVAIPHNAWFRGSLEGIESSSLAKMLSLKHKLSFNVLAHVVMQASLQNRAVADTDRMIAEARKVTLPRLRFERLLLSLRDWIARLTPSGSSKTVWQDYAENTTYASSEQKLKAEFVANFCTAVQPKMLWDIGCNTGDYSEIALKSGASRVIGFDFDQGALERAYARSRQKSLAFLPLFQDGANPSPDQGWAQAERKSALNRAKPDAIVALAFEHHLAIARNIPLPGVINWLTGMAPQGIVEFVQKSDPTVQKLLALREDIFPDYTQDNFETLLKSQARIVKSECVSEAGRTLYWYDRSKR